MPRQVDKSINRLLSEPDFYDNEQKEDFLQRKVSSEIIETRVAPLPKREDELDYMNWLEEDFTTDSWTDIKWKAAGAGPMRVQYKRLKQHKQSYDLNFYLNWFVGGAFFAPLGIYLGRKAQKTGSGVPMVYFAKNYHNFPNNNPHHWARNKFQLKFWGTMLLGGYIFSKCYTPSPTAEELEADSITMAAMVTGPNKPEHSEFGKVYPHQRRATEVDNSVQKGNWFRLFFPTKANYDLRTQVEEKIVEDRMRFLEHTGR